MAACTSMIDDHWRFSGSLPRPQPRSRPRQGQKQALPPQREQPETKIMYRVPGHSPPRLYPYPVSRAYACGSNDAVDLRPLDLCPAPARPRRVIYVSRLEKPGVFLAEEPARCKGAFGPRPDGGGKLDDGRDDGSNYREQDRDNGSADADADVDTTSLSGTSTPDPVPIKEWLLVTARDTASSLRERLADDLQVLYEQCSPTGRRRAEIRRGKQKVGAPPPTSRPRARPRPRPRLRASAPRSVASSSASASSASKGRLATTAAPIKTPMATPKTTEDARLAAASAEGTRAATTPSSSSSSPSRAAATANSTPPTPGLTESTTLESVVVVPGGKDTDKASTSTSSPSSPSSPSRESRRGSLAKHLRLDKLTKLLSKLSSREEEPEHQRGREIKSRAYADLPRSSSPSPAAAPPRFGPAVGPGVHTAARPRRSSSSSSPRRPDWKTHPQPCGCWTCRRQPICLPGTRSHPVIFRGRDADVVVLTFARPEPPAEKPLPPLPREDVAAPSPPSPTSPRRWHGLSPLLPRGMSVGRPIPTLRRRPAMKPWTRPAVLGCTQPGAEDTRPTESAQGQLVWKEPQYSLVSKALAKRPRFSGDVGTVPEYGGSPFNACGTVYKSSLKTASLW